MMGKKKYITMEKKFVLSQKREYMYVQRIMRIAYLNKENIPGTSATLWQEMETTNRYDRRIVRIATANQQLLSKPIP